VDVSTVQQFLGHTDLKTAMIYTHVLSRDRPEYAAPWMGAGCEVRCVSGLYGNCHAGELTRAAHGARRTHLRSVSGVQPIFSAIDRIASHCESYSWLMLEHHRHGPLPHLGCVLPRFVHDPILSNQTMRSPTISENRRGDVSDLPTI